jgi:hypothetical protein
MSERCEAKGCWSNSTQRVRVKRGDTLAVCETHASLLVAAGEVVETLPSFTDVAAVRQTGRPPVPIPDETLTRARQMRVEGKGIREVSRETGIERNTLRRRLQEPVVVEAPPQPVEVPVSQPPPPLPPLSSSAIQQAALYLTRAAALEKKGRALLQEAEALVAKAKAVLDNGGS